MLPSCFTIAYAAFLLNLGYCFANIDPVIVPQIIKSNILRRIRHASFFDYFDDAMTTAADACVLVFHDGSSSKTVISVQITCEAGDSRHADNDFVLLAVLIRSDATLSNGSSNLVPDWMLGITRSSNKELVLDVDEVLAVADDANVRVCNGVLER